MSDVALAPLTAGPSEELVAECQQVLEVHARSFSWGQVFLPPEGRDEAAILYAFCRLVDDLADDSPSIAVARAELEQVFEELHGCKPARPVVDAARQILLRGTGIGCADELIEGALSDQLVVRMDHDPALLTYCYRVAGVVGLMMCPVLGVQDEHALPYAIDLGIAMQLTNICRDVLEDARMDRVYLPRTRLEAVGVTHAELVAGTADRKAVAEVVSDLLDLADRYYDSGLAGARHIPLRSRVAIVVAARIYRAIGHRLRKNGGDALAGRTIVPWTGKLVQVGIAMFDSLLKFRQAVPPHDADLHQYLTHLPGTHAR